MRYSLPFEARRALFSISLALLAGACDSGADGGEDPGDAGPTSGGVGSTTTHTSASGNSTSQTSAATNAGGTSSSTTPATSGGGSGGTSDGGSGGASSVNGGGSSAGGSAAGGSGMGGSAAGGSSAGGSSAGGSSAGGSGGQDTSACDAAGLEWKSGKKTHYTSYPDPGSEECIVYNGCMWAGWFAHCDDQQSEAWVESNNIAAMFPDTGYELHDICVRSGDRTMIVTVYDTCGDSDCDGCCTRNKGDADALIDLESFTNARWGLPDGAVEWADLGPTKNNACE